jgi:RNA polymerase sporulation-specific sigma factor
MHFRVGKKQANDVYLSDTLEVDKDGNPLTIEDTICSDENLEESLETKIRWEKVSQIIEEMDDDREKEIIILRYGLDNKKPLTQREVAQRLNISRSYVSRIEKKVLRDIKNQVE